MIILRQSWKKAVPDIFLFLQILTSAPLLHLCVIPTPFVVTPKTFGNGQTCERKNVWIVREGTSVSKKQKNREIDRRNHCLTDSNFYFLTFLCNLHFSLVFVPL